MRNFSGVLNEDNVERVAAQIRKLFQGKQFVIASAQYWFASPTRQTTALGKRWRQAPL